MFQGCKNGTTSSISITMPSLMDAQKLGVLFVCLFVCPSRFRVTKIVRLTSPSTRWNIETVAVPLDRGRFVVV